MEYPGDKKRQQWHPTQHHQAMITMGKYTVIEPISNIKGDNRITHAEMRALYRGICSEHGSKRKGILRPYGKK